MADGEASGTGGPAAGGANIALYRKYRSATFAEVIGQDHVTVPLRQALSAGRINHAYLFSGPRGCGKTSSARILARSLNCAQGPTPEPCAVCDSCKELAPMGPGSIDVIEIDAASHGGVDDARDLRERAFFAPVRDRFKVYIVDEAHMVTTQGFNALLKLVEEPPDFLVFIFATTEPDKVLATIRSRTHHYPFRLIPPAVMRANLEKICVAEGVTVEPAVLPLVVRAGGGSARDSQSILDQLLAGAGAEGVTYASAVALLGVTDGALLDEMIDALAAGDAASVYGTVDRVVEAGHDPRRFSVDLLDRFRDLILLDAVPDAAERGLIDAPQDQLAQMADQAVRLGGATLARFAEIVHTALIEMRGTTSPRLVLELLCARMMLPDASTDAAAVLQRVERLERRLTAAGESSAADERARPAAARAAGASGASGSADRGKVAADPGARSAAREPAAERTTAGRTTAGRTTAERTTAGGTTPARATPPSEPRAEPTTAPRAEPAERPVEPAPANEPAASARSGDPASPSSVRPEATERPATTAPSVDSAARSAPPPAKPEPAAAPAVQPDAAPADPGALDASALRRLWPEVLEVVKQSSRRTRALLDNAQITTVAGELVSLAAPGALAKMIAEDSNTSVLRAALTKVVGGEWKIAVDGAAPAGQSADAPRRGPSGPSEPEADPRDDADYEPEQRADAPAAADPEAEAMKLLRDQLGARPLEG